MPLAARDIARRRLAGQRLAGERLADPLDVVRELCAVQAQDYAGAKWALSQRTDNTRDADVEALLANGRLVRTHLLRPTWHFVAREDLRWMLELTAPRVKQSMASSNRKNGLDDAIFRKSTSVIEKALARASHMSRIEIAERLSSAGIETREGNRLSHILMRAELDGVICSGPRAGKQFTYALLDERVPAAPARPREEALADLATRYFATRGPASATDFAWWSGLAVGEARRAVASISAALVKEQFGAAEYWSSSEAKTEHAKREPVHLLSAFDEYFIGLRDRSAWSLHAQDKGKELAYESISTWPVTFDGQYVGSWTRKATPRETVIEFDLLLKPNETQRAALAEQVKRFEAFIGQPVRALTT